MGFYFNNLEKIYNTEELRQQKMENMKNNITEKMEKEYDSLSKTYHSSLALPLGARNIDASHYQATIQFLYAGKIQQTMKELNEIRNSTTEEYFAGLINQEREGLNEYYTKNFDTFCNNLDKMLQLNRSTSLISKVNDFLGKTEEKIISLAQDNRVLDDRITVSEIAAKEWIDMSTADRTDYILYRYEIQQTTEFDEKGLDKLAFDITKEKYPETFDKVPEELIDDMLNFDQGQEQ